MSAWSRVGVRGLTVLLFSLAAWPAHAQTACTTAVSGPATGWAAPLSRSIAVHIEDLPLRQALARIATLADVRLSYSADLVPQDRTVCVASDAIVLGDLLASLLRGTTLTPVPAGWDHVVLAPGRAKPQAPAPAEPVVPLDPLVVQARAAGVAERFPGVSVAVLDADRTAQESGSIADYVNGAAGIWMWTPTPARLTTQWASLRGASAFGLSSPKVYIDGIEVANPFLLTRLTPESIERVEVIRGPQGGALFGADALNGVTNIVTRRASPGASGATLRSTFGVASTAFASRAALAQDHALGLRASTAALATDLNVTLGTTGAVTPGAYSRHVGADASARLVRSRASLAATLRFFSQRAGTPQSPLLAGAANVVPTQNTQDAKEELSLRQYTAGMTATFTPDRRWTHEVVAGMDGYRLNGLGDFDARFPTLADSALRAAGTQAMRVSLRLSSTARFHFGQNASGAFRLTAEHSVLHREGVELQPVGTLGQPSTTSTGPGFEHTAAPAEWTAGNVTSSTTGVGSQLNALLFERLALTSGIRFEQGDVALGVTRVVALPMLGGSYTTGHGPLSVQLRAAWGRGIRWPEISTHTVLGAFHDLPPEEQAGIEGGIDVTFRRTTSLHITRFDQTASGLIQRVAISRPGLARSSTLQNVGEITNRGWEIEASGRRGPLSLAGTATFVDSRVQKLGSRYTGDLRAGDRILAVPARTISLSATWAGEGWSAAVSGTRAADWVNYDRIMLGEVLANEDPADDGLGQLMRNTWREYAGITHLRISLTRDLGRDVMLVLGGQNLLNRQVGEPDNVTVMPGRSLTVGVRAAF